MSERAKTTIETIGKKLAGDRPRDAIHVAVMACRIADDFDAAYCGREVKLVPGTTNVVRQAMGPEYDDRGIGIIDPFMEDRPRLRPGDWVWIFLRPGSVTDLRHQWVAPGIDSPMEFKNESELWLRDFASRWNFDFDELITAGSTADQKEDGWGPFVVARGRDLHSAEELGVDHDYFWHHLEVYTGRKFDEAHRAGMGWSCSC